ncbi:hypothetical protein SELMODRAFT_174459 [Selaginella moellendorffii]|uniref:Pentacotripeptide-repeat region of PRORP domain-containing protein n=2 Tax=Selaginella moellendorffii TaxID=88036 RepID=D8RUC2_SELML|nr:hypothetical protein SELMODRAFT_174459 [Selaginella moellendorffii]
MPEWDTISWTIMITAYAHKGHIAQAQRFFDGIQQRDVASWNAMIVAYALNGYRARSIELLGELGVAGMDPDEVTFTSVMGACGHAGSVDAARDYLRSMRVDRGLAPREEHYACVIDALCRAGQIHRAEDLIANMPFLPGITEWTSLIAACKSQRDVERVLARVSELEHNSEVYVLLSNSIMPRSERVTSV